MGIGADYFSAVMHQELLVLGALFATVTGQYCRLLGKTARTLPTRADRLTGLRGVCLLAAGRAVKRLAIGCSWAARSVVVVA